jgi:membrane-associated protease RseP (regulator of RpoE activity)
MAEAITLFVKAGDPASEQVKRYLDQRGLTYTTRDVLTDPSATAILFGRLGRVTVPVVQVGDRLLVGSDPVQLARFLPREESDEPAVAFGAAVRSVTAEVAAAKGLPATYGVEVGSVKEGSAASAAGIVAGDIIVSIGGYTVTGGAEQFRRAVSLRHAGDSMHLGVWRDGETLDVTVTFPTAAPAPEPAAG